MVVLSCLIPNSEFTTDDVDVVGAAAILNVHSPLHSASALVASTPRAPRLERPKLQLNASTEEWNAFLRRWETFRIGSSFLNAVRSVRSGPLPHGYKERQRHANSKPPLIRYCQNNVQSEEYYNNEVIRDVLLNRVADNDICREALSTEGIQEKTVAEAQTLLAISSYCRSTNKQHNGQAERDNIDWSRTSTCPDGSKKFNMYTRSSTW